MVVFTCGHCGESLQKPKVEKHYQTKCRNRNPNLSCMDCFKDFYGTDYESHTKCITEEERYSGKGFVAKEKKGEKKQNAWVEMLQSVLDENKSASKNVLRIIETITKHNNTPRKKPKFVNFVKNVCGHKTNPKDIDAAWDLIAVKLSALSNANNNQNKNDDKSEPAQINGKANGVENGEEDKDTETKVENGHVAENGVENGDEETETVVQNGHEQTNGKKSKKQRKEEKKRQKYEAELQSAAVSSTLPAEEEEEEAPAMSKKDKKKKNRADSTSNADDVQTEGKNKKKRKRLDTAKAAQEIVENNTENVENEPVNKEKTIQKKKLKTDGEDAEESICLHDQNVLKAEEGDEVKGEKFNWHKVILSVLEKKGNEVPFKRLQKKVLAEYAEATGYDVDDRIADKFIKKLKSAPNVRVDKNRVYVEE